MNIGVLNVLGVIQGFTAEQVEESCIENGVKLSIIVIILMTVIIKNNNNNNSS
jgi:hypothetical protein